MSDKIVNTKLAIRIGHRMAMLLYWVDTHSQYARDTGGWFKLTHEQWANEFPFLSIGTIRNLINKAERDGFIESKQDDGFNRQKSYRIGLKYRETLDDIAKAGSYE